MANYERAELAHPDGTLYELKQHPSVHPAPKGAAIKGTTVWPTVLVQSEDIDGEPIEVAKPSPLAKQVDGAWVAATAGDIIAHNAAIVAGVQAVQHAKLQAIVDAAGDDIRELEAHIDYFEIERPATLKAAKIKVKEWKKNKKSQAKIQDQLDGAFNSLEMTLLFQGLADAGIDEATVHAVWDYMQATGQDVQT